MTEPASADGPARPPTPRRDDPGWPAPRFSTILAILTPGLLQRQTDDDTVPAIVPLRRLFSGFIVVPLLFLLVLVFALPVTADHLDDLRAWGLLALGVVSSIAGPTAARHRRVRCGTPAAISRQVGAVMLFGVATSQSATLLGFAAAFITGEVWPYLVALLPAGIGSARTAPTRGRIAATDRRLAAVGCPLSASEVLFARPGDPAHPATGRST